MLKNFILEITIALMPLRSYHIYKCKMIFLLFFLTFLLGTGCKEKEKIETFTSISLASIVLSQETSDVTRLNQCMGKSPGMICPTVITEYPIHVNHVDLYVSGVRISQVDLNSVPIIRADCTNYYQIKWEDHAPYLSTKLYLNTTEGEICGIGWETKDGKWTNKLIDLIGSEKHLISVTEINTEEKTLKFYR